MRQLYVLSRVLLATFALVVGMSLAADAFVAPNFLVINDGSHTIIAVYVEPSASDSWGQDLLGNNVLDPGYETHALTGYTLPSCIQDVKVIYSDKHIAYDLNVNVCTQYVTSSY